MATKLSTYELNELFADWLDETYGEVEICGHTFNAGEALLLVSPVAYEVAYSEWLETENYEELIWTE